MTHKITLFDQERKKYAFVFIKTEDIVRIEYSLENNALMIILSTKTYRFKSESKLVPYKKENQNGIATGGVQWDQYSQGVGESSNNFLVVYQEDEIESIFDDFYSENQKITFEELKQLQKEHAEELKKLLEKKQQEEKEKKLQEEKEKNRHIKPEPLIVDQNGEELRSDK